MARSPSDTDFTVNVKDIGSFTFGRRAMKDEIAIQVEYARIIDGVEPTAWLNAVAGWMAAFRVLLVRAPAGWDVDAMDPLDDDTYANLSRVYDALTEQERSFRRKPKLASEGSGAAAA